MKLLFVIPAFLLLPCLANAIAQQTDTIGKNIPKPVFKNGEAQIVPEFSSENELIREELQRFPDHSANRFEELLPQNRKPKDEV